MRRKPMKDYGSKKLFTKTADNVNSRNFRPVMPRGGYRI